MAERHGAGPSLFQAPVCYVNPRACVWRVSLSESEASEREERICRLKNEKNRFQQCSRKGESRCFAPLLQEDLSCKRCRARNSGNRPPSMGMAQQIQAHAGGKYAQLLADGARYASKKDWLEASRVYREAINLEPDQPKAYLNLGAVLIHSGNDLEGVKLYLEAMERLPEGSEAWGKATAEAFETLKLVEASRAAYKPHWWNDDGLKTLSAAVAKAAPNYCAAIGMRAEVLSGLGGEAWGGRLRRSAADFSKAATYFEQAANLHPTRAMKAELTKLADQCRREAVALTQ